MTKKALEKIEGTPFKTALDSMRETRKRVEKIDEKSANQTKYSIIGYLKAMRDFGVITERERQALFIYYATI